MKWTGRFFGAGWNSKFTRFLYSFPLFMCLFVLGFVGLVVTQTFLNFLYLLLGFWIGDDDELMMMIFSGKESCYLLEIDWESGRVGLFE